MTKKIYSAILLASAMAFASCGGSDDPVTPTPNPSEPADGDVEVTIATTSIETKAAMLDFKSKDQMNIYAKTYQRIDAPNIVDGVIATYDGSKWTMEPKVYINSTSQKNAFMYAVAPYDASYTDAQKIPVDLKKQVDLLYSGAYQPASVTSPQVKMNMKHALSLLTFNIIPVNYNGSGALKSIKLGGEIFYTDGTMDASTGKVTLGNTGDLEVTFDKKLENGGWKSSIPGVWALPFNTKAGTVNMDVNIDGKTYNLTLPEVEVKTGWQYIFRLVVTDHGIEFDPSKTETISLNVLTDQDQNFEGYGCLTFTTSGTWMNIPNIWGDAVFGMVSTPSMHKPYEVGIVADNLTAGSTVVVETWNSTGFKIESLDGVDTIDLSKYE